jgi:hypothetical protein
MISLGCSSTNNCSLFGARSGGQAQLGTALAGRVASSVLAWKGALAPLLFHKPFLTIGLVTTILS